ncbi:unnamed protein product (macronuclear) [Paramecium tetraurelia]|uniref:Dynein light chain n=2 Tax=Paramecium TaxID=5884 RepID=A0D9H3_PARTE|nr:uncharacterized protein GSPATT00014620001 [Paramecium tetraurelia]CAD8174066.1 unnamed protein product [Paramecium pentaurelia]CAK79690.1 unnamed protein product [Paramecium tetraurelia]|eukprot:XP_001447087.1 hypothetical protein (macronuclear) [Paramecium tetraurelia strain d4-2]
MEQIKLQIKATDMDEDFIKKVTDITQSAMQQFRSEKQIAHHIKYEFDKFDQFGWNCIVGRNFGSHVIHQTKKYIFYQHKELYFLLWKA